MIDGLPFPEAYRPPQIPVTEWSHVDRDRPVNYPIYEEREHYLATVAGYETNKYQITPELRAAIRQRWGQIIQRYGYDRQSEAPRFPSSVEARC